MKNLEETASDHPHPIDRNRAILWARDLVEFPDWVILACKVSRVDFRSVPRGDCTKLVSFAVLGPNDNVLLDVVLRPQGAVSTELLKMHGCDQPQVFKAPYFEHAHKIMQAGFAKTRVVCWRPAEVQEILDELCRDHSLAKLKGNFYSAQTEYSRYVGQIADGYLMQAIPDGASSNNPGVAPLTECRKISETIRHMAASSQVNDSALTFNKNWSAAFFRPKPSPTSKIREILGFPEA